MVSIHTHSVKNKNIFDIYYHGHSSVGSLFNSLYKWQEITNDNFNLSKSSILPANRFLISNNTYLLVIPVRNIKERWSDESNPLLSLPQYVINDINQKRACLLIDFSNEGGTFKLLELISQSLSIIGVKNFHDVIFVCQNRIINDSNNNGIKIFYYDSCIIKSCLTIINQVTPDIACSLINAYQNAKKDKIILCMNATPRPHRLHACGLLKNLHLFDNSLVSFPDLLDSKGKSLLLDREINFLSNTKLAYIIDSVKEITPYFPIKIDNFKEKGNALVDKISYENYISTWCSFVTETGINNSMIRVTEKSFKAVALGHPAIIYNHPNSIYLLKDFGYSLFEDIVPSNYDKMEDRIDRLIAIGEILQSFSNRILEKSPSLLSYLSENSSYNINWTLNSFLPKYRKEYVDPIFDFINKILA